MTAPIEILETLVPWLVAAAVKGSVMILLVLAILFVGDKRIPARWRYAMWLLVAVRLLLPAGPSSGLSLFNLFVEPGPVIERFEFSSSAAAFLPASNVPGPAHALPEQDRFGLAPIGLAWLIGLLLLVMRLLVSSIRLHRRIETSEPRSTAPAGTMTGDLDSLLAECLQIAGVRRPIRVVETEMVRTPALHGVRRPVLVFPRGMREMFSEDELRHILLHELAHFRRRDVMTNWLISLIQIVHWFNPLVWLAVGRMREERELACDELALSWLEQDQRLSYGRTILKLLERFRPSPPIPVMVGILNGKQQVKRRLMMIKSFQNPSRYAVLFVALVAALAVVSLTDAEAGNGSRLRTKADPATFAVMQRLDTPLTLELQNATLADLLNAISNKSGVAVTQAPELLADPVQQARISLTAKGVPAHLALIESLSALGLICRPEGEVIVVAKGEGLERMCLEHHEKMAGKDHSHMDCARQEAEGHDHAECMTDGKNVRKIVVKRSPEHAARSMAVLEGELPPGETGQRIFVRKVEEDVVAGEGQGDKVVIRKIDGPDVPGAKDGEKRVFLRKIEGDSVPTGTEVEKEVFIRKIKGEAAEGQEGVIRRKLVIRSGDGTTPEGTLELEIKLAQ